MSDRSIAGTVGGKGKISSRKLKQLTETAIAQYAAAVSLERNPATFGDAVIDISNNLNVQSANAFSAVKRAFAPTFMSVSLGADPAGIRRAWCRRLGRRGEAFRGRVRELGKQHSPKLTTHRIACK